jgi:hypothetical protein
MIGTLVTNTQPKRSGIFANRAGRLEWAKAWLASLSVLFATDAIGFDRKLKKI